MSSIIFLGLMWGCVLSRHKDQKAVDETYLKSSSFKSFQNAYLHERQVRQQQTSDLEKIIHQHERDFTRLSLPVTLDEKKMNDVLAGKHVEGPFLYGSYYAVGSLYIIGKVKFKEVTLFLFLQNNVLRTYNEYVILGATLYNGTIQDVQPLAGFRKNLTEHTKSFVRIVSQNHMVVWVQKKVQYSSKFIIAENTKSEYHYPISLKGRILNPDRF